MSNPYTNNYRTASIEDLEGRVMLAAAAPHVIEVSADNRGEVSITFDAAVNRSTLTTRSVNLLVGRKKIPAEIFSAAKQVVVRAKSLKINASYAVRLNSTLIRGTNGLKLDGEFNGPTQRSGNGRPGGDYVAVARRSRQLVARFTTLAGNIDVQMFSKQTPLTVANFANYANTGAWDYSFFNRSIRNVILQGGGFRVGSTGLEPVPEFASPPNEPHPNNPGNVLGTIAMAKLPGQPNSATNQFFFNETDNRKQLDSDNGGFTVFGKVADKASLTVLQTIGRAGVFNASSKMGGIYSSNFQSLPVTDLGAVQARMAKNPNAPMQYSDLVLIYRVAFLMNIAGWK